MCMMQVNHIEQFMQWQKNEVDEIDINIIINKKDASYNNVQIYKSVNKHESSKKLLDANIDCTINEINNIMKLFKFDKIITL